MALSAEARGFVDAALSSGGKPLHEMTLLEARRAIGDLLANSGAIPEVAQVDSHPVNVVDGEIEMRVVLPRNPPRAVILYLHGGGWVGGTAKEHEAVGRQIAAATGCIVAIPDYRLAPEVRFPLPLDDCWAAAKWCVTHFDLPLVVLGDSAGGNLAAAMTHRAKGLDVLPIAAQVLIYPVTDHGMNTPSYTNPDNHLLLTPQSMAWFWDHYLPDPAGRRNPLASPLQARSFSGLPPALAVIAEHDILADEGLAYPGRLAEAGVRTRVHIAEGQIHGFFVLGGLFPAAGRALAWLVDELNLILSGQPSAAR